MKVGVSTACFFEKEHVESTFDLLRSINVTTTEVFLNTFSEYEKPFVEALNQRRGEMKVHSLHAHGTCFEPELFSNYSRIRNDAEQVFRKVCSAGFMLGAKYLTFHGPFIKYNRRIDVDYGKFCERLNELESIAESYGIQIAYENVNWAYFNTPDFFKTIKQNCPNVKATLDIKQAVLSDIDVHKYIDVMEDRLVTLHACGMDGKKPVMVGAGKINYDKLLSELSSTHPDLAIILEVYSNSFESLSELRAGYMKLCEIVNKAQ